MSKKIITAIIALAAVCGGAVTSWRGSRPTSP